MTENQKQAMANDDKAFTDLLDFVYKEVDNVDVAYKITKLAINFAARRGEWIHTLYNDNYKPFADLPR